MPEKNLRFPTRRQPLNMLTINDLKSKMIVLIEGAPYQILEVKHLHMGRGGSSLQTRIKNLRTGQVLAKNFKPADTFAEADVEKRTLGYLYGHRGECVFADPGNPSERFSLPADALSETAQWLKPGAEVAAMFLDKKLIAVSAPIKVDLAVVEAPPGFKGDTVSGATKTVILETGAKVQVPLFIDEGDVIRVNTETGEYDERVTKA